MDTMTPLLSEKTKMPSIPGATSQCQLSWDRTSLRIIYDWTDHDGVLKDRVIGTMCLDSTGRPYVSFYDDTCVITTLDGCVEYDNRGIQFVTYLHDMTSAIRKAVLFYHRMHMSTPRLRTYYK
nr:MAG TPA: hypothetical protein [Caudoviricetes sp.]